MNLEEFNKKKSEISDKELLEKGRKILSDLCQNGATNFRMSVPVRLDDSDIILSEIMDRFSSQLEQEISLYTPFAMVKIKINKEDLEFKEDIEKWILM